MTWRCALLQKRLPDYPDGELSPFWKRLVAAHLESCPECRQEWQELVELQRLYREHPLPDPGEAFWQQFNQEVHLKLAQVNQAPPASRWRLRLPHYLTGAAALAGVLALAVYLGPFGSPTPAPPLVRQAGEANQKLATRPGPPAGAPAPTLSPAAPSAAARKALPAVAPAPQAPPGEASVNLAAGRLGREDKNGLPQEGLWPDDDILSWDVDAVVADLSREERAHLREKLETGR